MIVTHICVTNWGCTYGLDLTDAEYTKKGRIVAPYCVLVHSDGCPAAEAGTGGWIAEGSFNVATSTVVKVPA